MSNFFIALLTLAIYVAVACFLIATAEKFYSKNVPKNEEHSVSIKQGEDDDK